LNSLNFATVKFAFEFISRLQFSKFLQWFRGAGLSALDPGEIRMEDKKPSRKQARVTLKTVADHLGLTPGTISAVLNDTYAARRIPQSTKDRILAAVREFNYQPNPLARALRTGQSIMPNGGEARENPTAHGALVILGEHQFLRAISAIQQAGLRVPDDFSVVGFDDLATATLNYSAFSAAPKPP
jgi:transcriptional regulator with XRE-family HTH domain